MRLSFASFILFFLFCCVVLLFFASGGHSNIIAVFGFIGRIVAFRRYFCFEY